MKAHVGTPATYLRVLAIESPRDKCTHADVDNWEWTTNFKTAVPICGCCDERNSARVQYTSSQLMHR